MIAGAGVAGSTVTGTAVAGGEGAVTIGTATGTSGTVGALAGDRSTSADALAPRNDSAGDRTGTFWTSAMLLDWADGSTYPGEGTANTRSPGCVATVPGTSGRGIAVVATVVTAACIRLTATTLARHRAALRMVL